MQFRIKLLTLLSLITLACMPGFMARQEMPTATPTKTPSPIASPTSLHTPTSPPSPTPTDPPPTATPPPTETPIPPTKTSRPPTETPQPTATNTPPPPTPLPTEPPPPEPEPAEEESPPAEEAEAETAAEPPSGPYAATAGGANAEEPAYRISHFKVLGEGENNGGIFNKGGFHMIFAQVVDANGNGIDGAILKDANGSDLEVVVGDKGPGKAEIVMNWEPYKLYVAADPSGPTTSEISSQLNTAYPHIPDVVGKLGSLDNEYSVCPTPDVRCEPPFYNVHFSYEITFQKVN